VESGVCREGTCHLAAQRKAVSVRLFYRRRLPSPILAARAPAPPTGQRLQSGQCV
jgi:hypothetical protein